MTGPTNGENRLTFGDDPVADTDSHTFPVHSALLQCKAFQENYWHFSHSCCPLFTKLGEITDDDNLTFREQSGGHPENPDHFWLRQPKFKGHSTWRWRRFVLSEYSRVFVELFDLHFNILKNGIRCECRYSPSLS